MNKMLFLSIYCVFFMISCAESLRWESMSIVDFPKQDFSPPRVIIFKTNDFKLSNESLRQSTALRPEPISQGVWKYHIPPDFWLQVQPQFAYIIVDSNNKKVWMEAELFLGFTTIWLAKKMMLKKDDKMLRHLRIRGITGWIYQFYCEADRCETMPVEESSL